VRLLFSGRAEKAVNAAAAAAAKALRADARGNEVLGPAPAVLAKLRGEFRCHLLLKIPDPARAEESLEAALSLPVPSTVRLKADVDPYDFF